MALSKLANNPDIGFLEYRESFYYGLYKYKALFKMPGVHALWNIHNVRDFDRKLLSDTTTDRVRRDMHSNRESLLRYIDWKKLNASGPRKGRKATIRVEGNTVSVFSNDLILLKTVQQITGYENIDYVQAVPCIETGVKMFARQPKHKFRIQLKTRRMSISDKEALLNFLNQHPELHPCDALLWAINSRSWRSWYISSGYFIDYDDEATLSYLMLMYGELLGKNYRLEKRPEAM